MLSSRRARKPARTRPYLLALLPLVALVAASCSPQGSQPPAPSATPPASPAPSPEATVPQVPPAPSASFDPVVRGLAAVESVDVLILESMPVQARAVIKGYLQDGCTELAGIEQPRSGNTFIVKVTTTRPAGAACIEIIKPFEETVTLDVLGLKAGTYTVDANGITTTFELAVDNVSPTP